MLRFEKIYDDENEHFKYVILVDNNNIGECHIYKEYDFDFDGYDVEISIVAENPRHIFFPRNLFEAISAKSNY